ncbi:MAG: alpha/beta hydrolase [Lachnospiraceae bacterium]|nr:alpha/beta hydrolase [Lachnospiraceae bacterium]
MLDIIYCVVCIVLFVAIAFVIPMIINKSRLKKEKGKIHPGIRAGVGIGGFVLGAGLFAFLYLNSYYHAVSDEVAPYIQDHEGVKVTRISKGWFFDGAESERAFIFYPGAKVEAKSYAPFLSKMALSGIDCFLVEMPYELAVFDVNAADSIMDNYEYNEWMIGGHSLGGNMAAKYAKGKEDKFKKVIMLASYPSVELSDDVEFLSIFGSKDGILNFLTYEKNRAKWPENWGEEIIKDGNHSQFGNYGRQDFDGKAGITADEQQQQTVELILESLEEE